MDDPTEQLGELIADLDGEDGRGAVYFHQPADARDTVSVSLGRNVDGRNPWPVAGQENGCYVRLNRDNALKLLRDIIAQLENT